jgi:hypothetical protein
MAVNSDKLFNEYMSKSRSDRMVIAKRLYKQLKDQITKASDFTAGFFAPIRIACGLLAADGKFGADEYNFYVEMTGHSCSYAELNESVCEVSKNFDGMVQECRKYGHDVMITSACLGVCIASAKGYLTDAERAIINAITR